MKLPGRLLFQRQLFQGFISLTAAWVYIVAFIIFARLAPAELTPEVHFYLGVWLSGVTSFFAMVAAIHLTSSDDLLLSELTPLRPSLYYTHNLARMGLIAVTMGLAVPLLSLLYFWTLSGNTPLHGSFYAVNFALTYYLFLLAPIYERLTGRRRSYLFFLPRIILRLVVRTLPGVWIVCIVLFAAFGKVAGIVPFSARGLLHDTLELMLNSGLAGRLIYYCVLPFAGLFHLHEAACPAWIPPALTLALLLALAYVLYEITRQWFLRPEEWDRLAFEKWSEMRESIERREERVQAEADKQSPHSVVCAVHDGFLRMANAKPLEIEMDCPVYSPTLTPEYQLQRHFVNWRDRRKQAPIILTPWLLTVLGAWLVWIAMLWRPYEDGLRRQTVDYFFAFLCWALAAIAIHWRTVSVWNQLAGVVMMPMRWGRMIRNALVSQWRCMAGADALAAALVCAAFQAPWWLFALVLPTIWSMRHSSLMSARLFASLQAGHRLPYRALSILGLVLLAAVGLVFVAQVFDVRPGASERGAFGLGVVIAALWVYWLGAAVCCAIEGRAADAQVTTPGIGHDQISGESPLFR
jgi:hypothetical protein